MGFGGISIWQLLIILVIVLLLFGTKRLRGLGGDLGGAIKGFKKAIKDDNSGKDANEDADTETHPHTKTDADPENREKAASGTGHNKDTKP